MKTIRAIAFILIILVAINWGLVGLLQIDGLAALMGGPTSTFSRIVYSLIGIAGLIAAVTSLARDGNPSRPTFWVEWGAVRAQIAAPNQVKGR